MKKIIAVTLITAMAGALCVGCGSENSEVKNKEDKSITLTLIDHTSEDIKVEWEDSVIEGFMDKHPEVEIEVQRMSMDDYTQTIATKFASDDAPDIFYEDVSTLPTYIENGYVADLTDTEAAGRMREGACDMLSKDGKIYAIPISGNCYVVTYNKKAFEKAGVKEVPKTQKEFYEVCEKLQAAGIRSFGLGYADSWTLTGDFQTDYVNNLLVDDPEMIVKLENRTETWSGNKAWKDALTRLAKRYSYANADPFGTDWVTACTDLANGDCAMILNGDWTSNNAAAYGDTSDFGAFALPVTDNAEDTRFVKPVGGQGYCLNANSENLDMAKEFLNYMTSEECISSYLESCQEVCLVKDVEFDNAKGALFDILSIMDTQGVDAIVNPNFSNEYNEAVTSCLSEFLLSSEKDVDAALVALDAEFDRIAGK